MKKVILILILMIFICGCKKQDTFKHYDLSNVESTYFTQVLDDGEKIYALSDITPDDYESTLTGLFLKINEKDYILLETLESSINDAYKSKLLYYFYYDKLYGVGSGNTPKSFIIELEGKNSILKEIDYKFNNNVIIPSSIKSVDDDYIEISGTVFINEHSESKNFICDKINYECTVR